MKIKNALIGYILGSFLCSSSPVNSQVIDQGRLDHKPSQCTIDAIIDESRSTQANSNSSKSENSNLGNSQAKITHTIFYFNDSNTPRIPLKVSQTREEQRSAAMEKLQNEMPPLTFYNSVDWFNKQMKFGSLQYDQASEAFVNYGLFRDNGISWNGYVSNIDKGAFYLNLVNVKDMTILGFTSDFRLVATAQLQFRGNSSDLREKLFDGVKKSDSTQEDPNDNFSGSGLSAHFRY